MHNLINVATHMFHGLLLVYQDSVIESPDAFAKQALHLADRLLANTSLSTQAGAPSPPTQLPVRDAQESAALIAQIITDHQRLLSQIGSLDHHQNVERISRTLH
ncbi:hypothetical protein [Pseudoxanthomonas sp.]|jgi:hypothetical protein|uniref:hypothetical protein n=1 Tax=Pseudoxanthomonas sp. TaxID=1871049 RepID=UPI002FE39700